MFRFSLRQNVNLYVVLFCLLIFIKAKSFVSLQCPFFLSNLAKLLRFVSHILYKNCITIYKKEKRNIRKNKINKKGFYCWYLSYKYTQPILFSIYIYAHIQNPLTHHQHKVIYVYKHFPYNFILFFLVFLLLLFSFHFSFRRF